MNCIHLAQNWSQWYFLLNTAMNLLLPYKMENFFTISHPDMRTKHCAYDNSVATLLNPRGVTTVSHKYSLTAARQLLFLLPYTIPIIIKYKYTISDEIKTFK
jgi:hypothetical protein